MPPTLPDDVTGPADTTNDTGPEFADLGLRAELLTALATLGYEEPTPIQTEAIPHLLAGHDLLGQAATGTGKTAAFALPILERLGPAGRRGHRPSALVLTPTRELAMQVSEAIHKYGRHLEARVIPVYGGQPIGRQLQGLSRGVDVVVATPGRAIDHLERGSLDLADVGIVVLDEADEMLDMGFAEDIESILERTPEGRQTVMFSATMPPWTERLAATHMHEPVRIRIARPVADPGTAPLVRQVAYVVPRAYKAAALGRILDVEAPDAALVFCKTRLEVDELTETLNGRGYRAEALHGGMGQEQRDRVMGRLRGGTADLLIATDVAARGLDVDLLTHVVNYDLPSAPETYVHRIGRVGRAGREGVAITLAEPRQQRLLDNIERSTGQRITVAKVPTVADLRTRRLEITRDAVRDAVVDGDLDPLRAVLEALLDEFDVEDIALGALRLAHDAASGTDDDEEIPDVTERRERRDRFDRDRGPRDDRYSRDRERGGRDDRGFRDRDREGDRFSRDDRGPRPDRGRERSLGAPSSKVFIGIGKSSGVRPGDLVGAITGETHLRGNQVGAISLFERHSLVEVPEDSVDDVISALRSTTIKGQRPTVRRDRQPDWDRNRR